MADEIDYKRVIRKLYSRLIEDLDPQPLLDQFIQYDFLPSLTIRDIQEERLTSEKNRLIVDKVLSKGANGYRKFKKLLRNCHQGHITDALEKMEGKLKQDQKQNPAKKVNQGPSKSGTKTETSGIRGQEINEGGKGATNVFDGANIEVHGDVNLNNPTASNETGHRSTKGNAPEFDPSRHGAVNIGGKNAINVFGNGNVTVQGNINIGGATGNLPPPPPQYSSQPVFHPMQSLQPGFNQQYSMQPGYNQPQPGYNQPQPGYNQPQPGCYQPQSGYYQPQPGNYQPQPGLSQLQSMQPGFNQPQSMHPGVNQSQPGFNQPQSMQLGFNQPQPGFNQPQSMQPGINQPQSMQPGINQPQSMQPGNFQLQPLQPVFAQPQSMQPGINQPQISEELAKLRLDKVNTSQIGEPSGVTQGKTSPDLIYSRQQQGKKTTEQPSSAHSSPVLQKKSTSEPNTGDERDPQVVNRDGSNGVNMTVHGNVINIVNYEVHITVTNKEYTPEMENVGSDVYRHPITKQLETALAKALSSMTEVIGVSVKEFRQGSLVVIFIIRTEGLYALERLQALKDLIKEKTGTGSIGDFEVEEDFELSIYKGDVGQNEGQSFDQPDAALVKGPGSDHVTIVHEITQRADGSERTSSHEEEHESGLSHLNQRQEQHVYKDVDDGRIHKINVKWLEKEIEKKATLLESKNQGMTEIYLLNDEVPEWGFRVVVKKVTCASYAYNMIPLMNEILAGRLRHHAIVPLLAKCQNEDVYYFVFPYMEKGDLMKAIADDTIKISNGQAADMKPVMRVRALYQIACAMLYIHTPVKDLRHRMFHGDITSRNIVLDKDGNIRLLDFGGAQELKPGQESVRLQTGDVYGTPGYTTTNSLEKLSTKTDCKNFGVLILEMLTGERPIKGGIELQRRSIETLEIHYDTLFEKMWKAIGEDKYKKLKELAKECLAKRIDAKEITTELYSMLCELTITDVGPAFKKGVKCAMCMLNKADDTTDNLFLEGCLLEKPHVPPAVCVACMRNSYINPIQCLKCRETIHTKIGSTWAAILIEGFEEDDELAAGIRNDLEVMRQLLISKCPLVTGIDENNVLYTTMSELISVEPGNLSNRSPGATSKQGEFANQLGKLLEDPLITTIWIYYSGHHSTDSGFYIGENKSLSVKDFENKFLNKVTKDLLIFMDCCSSACFKSQNIKLQLNASKINEKTKFSKKGSHFTRLVIQSLRGKSSGQCWLSKENNTPCIFCEEYKPDVGNRGFISGHLLYKNIYDHIKQSISKNFNDQSPPDFLCKLSGPSDILIGYHTDKELAFELYEDESKTCCEVAEIITEKQLKTELLKQKLNLKYEVDGETESYGEHLEKYWDIVGITICKGPRDVDELCSIPEIIRAWNIKLELSYGMRKLENIHMGRVGVFFFKGYSASHILKGYWKRLALQGTEDTHVVKIPWKKLDTTEFTSRLKSLGPTESQSKDTGYKWCWEAWKKLTDNQKIKEAKNVVFTVPEHHDRDDFMVIELEKLEVKDEQQVDE